MSVYACLALEDVFCRSQMAWYGCTVFTIISKHLYSVKIHLRKVVACFHNAMVSLISQLCAMVVCVSQLYALACLCKSTLLWYVCVTPQLYIKFFLPRKELQKPYSFT